MTRFNPPMETLSAECYLTQGIISHNPGMKVDLSRSSISNTEAVYSNFRRSAHHQPCLRRGCSFGRLRTGSGVVGKGRQDRAAFLDFRQPILMVKDLGVGRATNRPCSLVTPSTPLGQAIGVVAIAIAMRRGHGVGLGRAVGVGTARHVGDVAPSAGSGQAAS